MVVLISMVVRDILSILWLYRTSRPLGRHAPSIWVQYIPRNMHTVFALLCFVVVIHWLILPYPSGLLHWHCGNLTIAPVPAKQPWWIWINTSCEFIMNDCITTTKQSTTKPCAYFLGYTVPTRSYLFEHIIKASSKFLHRLTWSRVQKCPIASVAIANFKYPTPTSPTQIFWEIVFPILLKYFVLKKPERHANEIILIFKYV